MSKPKYGRRFGQESRDRFVELMCAGLSLQAAAEVVGASRAGGRLWWRKAGGMPLEMGRCGGVADFVPDSGFPRGRALSRDDRVVIQVGLRNGWSCARIGREIGRNRCVVWKEIQRHRSPDGSYHASRAELLARQGRRRPRLTLLEQNPQLCRRIEEWMDVGWSPKLIASFLAEDPETGRVSHETIYRALYVQTRGALRADLAKKLSLKRTARVPRGGAAKRHPSPYKEAFTISQRPAEVEDRAVPGHWEGDLILGGVGKGAVGTLVERSTRFVILLHLPGRHTADEVATAMIREMGKLPEHLRRSITWDRGVELADYRRIQLELEAPVFFCDPHSPWQRGSNENTNRLLRFWLEKGSDLTVHSAEDLDRIAATLNARPRPTLDLRTPAQALKELLQLAA